MTVTKPNPETPLWYLHHEDYWAVYSALSGYMEFLGEVNDTEAVERVLELQRKLREVR